MGKMKKICVSTFVNSEYGRRLLAGVGDSISSSGDWSLRFVGSHDLKLAGLQDFDGFICDVRTDKMARELRRIGRPVVDLLHLDDSCIRFPSVRTDHQAIGALAAEHFIDRRFVNFAYCGFAGVGFSNYRRNGFIARLRNEGRDAECYAPCHIRRQFREIIDDNISTDFQDSYFLEKWLRTLSLPIGIFCCNDERASNVLAVCRRLKLRVPEDVAILGVDNDPVICQLASPQISSIDPNPYTVGCEAVKLLNELFAGRVSKNSSEVRMVQPIGIFSRFSSQIYPVEPKWLSDALCYIHRNATKGISSADVFKHLGYSHTLVQRAFKLKLGTTVQREIANTRLSEARKLVIQGAFPMAEIAKRCGFSTAEYFCHCFTAEFGGPPSSFLGSRNAFCR